jgi:hypothetical protein
VPLVPDSSERVSEGLSECCQVHSEAPHEM